MSEIIITGLGIVSAMGIGVNNNIYSLKNNLSGISSRPIVLKSKLNLPVGEIHFTNNELSEYLTIPSSRHLSRTALLGIMAVKEALSNTDFPKNARVALVSATSVAGMDLTELFYKEYDKDNNKGRLRDVKMHDCGTIARVIAEYSGINGYVSDISTACSSAANAILFAAKLLKYNVADYVVAGGCDALSIFTLNGFNALKVLDSDICRPFDNSRCGLNLGEGAGFLLMQRDDMPYTEKYCTFAGGVNANDAFHQTASSDSGTGAFLAMSNALKNADILPEEVSYINAHGTATVNNDASESAAILRLFGNKSMVPHFSSIKAFTGHTLAASGGIEAVLSAIAVKNGYLYPNLNFSNPIDNFELVPVTHFSDNNQVNCVVSNSFGFGGNCTSLIFKK
ncbi:MAG: beta-ketoacyl-[acyl-carrier-protein] synthase family protein [Candidatus Aphodosoma sp.]